MAEVAGAIAGPDTLTLAPDVPPQAALARTDAPNVFAALGDLVVAGPTLTGVNACRAFLNLRGIL